MKIQRVETYFNSYKRKCFKVFYECPVTSNTIHRIVELHSGYYFNLLLKYMTLHKTWMCMIDNNYEIIYLEGPFCLIDRRGFGKGVENLIDVSNHFPEKLPLFLDYNQYTKDSVILLLNETIVEINYYDFNQRVQLLQEHGKYEN